MAATTVTGSEWLNKISEDTGDITFRNYLTFGTLSNENWDSQNYNPDSGTNTLSFRSTVGSTLKYSSTGSGSDSNGMDKGSVAIIGKSNGTNMSGTWANSWTNNSDNSALNVSWTYTGGTASKEDDFKYKYIVNSKSSWNSFDDASGKGSKGVSIYEDTVDFSNANYIFSKKNVSNGKYIWSDSEGKLTSDNSNSSTSLSFKDFQNNIAFSLSGVKYFRDEVTQIEKLEVGSMKFISSDLTVATAKFSNTYTGFELDRFGVNDDSGDLASISNGVRQLAAYLLQDNAIIITATSGFEIDAGAGNDSITGGLGNDIITGGLGNDIITGGLGNDSILAGAGKDKLTGGKGDDVYKISKSDYDFTSAKTVLADTIADFKYTATEKDSISFDGFGDVDVFQTLALAKKAGSTANVIYESKTGNFWYNEDGDSALAGALLFANAKGISDTYWIAAGVM